MTQVDLAALAAHLDAFLAVLDIPDGPGSLNGLQVENSGSVTGIVAAVDACQATIDGTIAAGANLLLVHHGLFWGDPQPLTGRHYSRVRALLEADVALYSAHLPLDCHSELGNSAVLARELGLDSIEPFAEYKGIPIGVQGVVHESRDSFVRRVAQVLGGPPHVVPGGPAHVSKVGIVTGSGGSMLEQARSAGIDTFLTGEGTHHTHFDAEEWGLNLIFGGHYATETFGVKALAEHIRQQFGVPWEFFDHPTGL
ncbi:MAG: Nif3-like dinuclear metal center hexameric protein [Gemmatimonadetes bacterium]|nr:Nif3-like dinuclear metal center hexameric protein [Gemmatimonadota bacterium]